MPKHMRAAAAVKSLQSCPTLCDPIDSSPPGSPVPGILLARTLEWVAISFSSARKWKVKVKSLSHVRLLATPWTEACHAPPSTMGQLTKQSGSSIHWHPQALTHKQYSWGWLIYPMRSQKWVYHLEKQRRKILPIKRKILHRKVVILFCSE